MKKLSLLYYVFFSLAGAIFFSSCSQAKKERHYESQEQVEKSDDKDHDHSGMKKEGGNHEESASHNHGDAQASATGTNSWAWVPNTGDDILSDFHFIAGSSENISPKITQGDGGANILQLTADGTAASFVFHSQYGNIGATAAIKRTDFTGTLKILHHAKDQSNYEFVAINENQMKLGRVVNGEEKIFNESIFSQSSEWITLKVTAAGSHYKGFIDDKNITHGHGDQIESGYVGLMLEGTGKLQIKSFEVVLLEDE